jgi:hypothetical protein
MFHKKNNALSENKFAVASIGYFAKPASQPSHSYDKMKFNEKTGEISQEGISYQDYLKEITVRLCGFFFGQYNIQNITPTCWNEIRVNQYTGMPVSAKIQNKSHQSLYDYQRALAKALSDSHLKRHQMMPPLNTIGYERYIWLLAHALAELEQNKQIEKCMLNYLSLPQVMPYLDRARLLADNYFNDYVQKYNEANVLPLVPKLIKAYMAIGKIEPSAPIIKEAKPPLTAEPSKSVQVEEEQPLLAGEPLSEEDMLAFEKELGSHLLHSLDPIMEVEEEAEREADSFLRPVSPGLNIRVDNDDESVLPSLPSPRLR